MSFYKNNKLVNCKPKLVDKHILKKIKQKQLFIKQNNNNNNIFKNSCFNFCKNNYGIMIIFIILICLLYCRYKDVKQKRNKILK